MPSNSVVLFFVVWTSSSTSNKGSFVGVGCGLELKMVLWVVVCFSCSGSATMVGWVIYVSTLSSAAGWVVVCVTTLGYTTISTSIVVCVWRSSSTEMVGSVVDFGSGIKSLKNLVFETLNFFLAIYFLLTLFFPVAVACTWCCALTL